MEKLKSVYTTISKATQAILVGLGAFMLLCVLLVKVSWLVLKLKINTSTIKGGPVKPSEGSIQPAPKMGTPAKIYGGSQIPHFEPEAVERMEKKFLHDHWPEAPEEETKLVWKCPVCGFEIPDNKIEEFNPKGLCLRCNKVMFVDFDLL